MLDPNYEKRFLKQHNISPSRPVKPQTTPTKKSLGGDRYIPVRSSEDWHLTFRSPESSSTNSPGTSSNHQSNNDWPEAAAYKALLKNELLKYKIDDLRSKDSSSAVGFSPPSVRRSLFQYQIDRTPTKSESVESSLCLSPISPESQKLLRSPRKPVRKIPKVPFKVLDAPELQDDFYLNLVDWSSNNVLAVGLGSSVYLWSARTSQVTKLYDLNSDSDIVTSVAWSDKGALLSVGTHNGYCQIWDTEASKRLHNLEGHKSRIGCAAWNDDLVCTGSRDRSILQRDIRAPADSTLRRMDYHKQEVCGLRWSPCKQYLASGGNDNKLLIWALNSSQIPVQVHGDHSAAVKAIAWSPHHHGLLASGGGTADRHIRFWNTLTSQGMQSVDTGSQVCNVAWSKHSMEMVSTHGYSQNEIIIWKYPSLQQVAKLTGHTYRVLYLAVSPDGESIVTGAGDETLRFWNVFSKQRQRKSNMLLRCTQPLSLLGLLCLVLTQSTVVKAGGSSESWVSIGMTHDFEIIDNWPDLTDAQMNLTKEALDDAVSFYNNLLTVQTSGFTVEVNVVNKHGHCFKNGRDTNILASAHAGNHTTKTRPTVGIVNVCKNKVPKRKDSSDYGRYKKTLKHEIVHALGLSNGTLHKLNGTGDPPFRLENLTLSWLHIDNVTKRERRDERIFTFVKSPKVMEFLMKHLNCTNKTEVMGAALQEASTPGTAGSHFDQLWFGPELMTGRQSMRTYFTNLTVALLIDTGWYGVNNASEIEELYWGKNAGCEFLKMSCYEYMKSDIGKRPNRYIPYCFKDKDTIRKKDMTTDHRYPLRCNADRTAVESCSLRHIEDVPETSVDNEIGDTKENKAYYYKDGYFAADSLKSFCPTWQVGGRHTSITDGDKAQVPVDHTCLNGKRDGDFNFNAESFGNDSRCIETSTKVGESFRLKDCVNQSENSLPHATRQSDGFGAACYKYRCQRGRLQLQPDGVEKIGQSSRWLTCYAEGNRLSVSRQFEVELKDKKKVTVTSQGTIICPKCEDLCDYCKKETKGIESRDTFYAC